MLQKGFALKQLFSEQKQFKKREYVDIIDVSLIHV